MFHLDHSTTDCHLFIYIYINLTSVSESKNKCAQYYDTDHFNKIREREARNKSVITIC